MICELFLSYSILKMTASLENPGTGGYEAGNFTSLLQEYAFAGNGSTTDSGGGGCSGKC